MFEKQVKDYKERFEFKLTVGNNIIIQRYFRINNFNPRSLKSFELADVIRNCASIIDNELKSKTQTYLEIAAPMVFNTVEDMKKYFSDEKHADERASFLYPSAGFIRPQPRLVPAPQICDTARCNRSACRQRMAAHAHGNRFPSRNDFQLH